MSGNCVVDLDDARRVLHAAGTCGAEALFEDQVTGEEVEFAMEAPSLPERVAAMFSLLNVQ